jgi:hypothetical protein
MDSDEQPTPIVFGYVGRCRTCRAALAWRRDRRSQLSDVARKVAKMIAADLIVEYTRADTVHMAREMCACERLTAMQLVWED